MPGKHVDEVYEKARQLVQFKKFDPSEEQEKVALLTTEQKTAYQKNKEDSDGKKMGKRVFTEIENSPLTPAEKQEVYLKLAQEGVKREIEQTEHIGTLMRTDSALTQFMSTYMGTYAKGYVEAMTETAVKEVGKIEVPEWAEGIELGLVGAPVKGVTEEQMQQINQVYVDVARKLAQASEDHLSKLSPEARGFLTSTLAPLRETDTATLNFVATNTLILRTVCPQVQIAGTKMEDRNLGRIVQNSNIVFQSYSNRLTSDKKGTKPQDALAEDLISDEKLKGRTLRVYSALADPGSLNELLHLKKVEAKLEKLNESGPNLEKLKAKVSKDGIGGTKDKLVQEIDTLEKKLAVVDVQKEKTGIEVKDVGEVVEVPTPNQTVPIKQELKVDDLDQLIDELATEIKQDELAESQTVAPKKLAESQTVAPKKTTPGLDELDQLIQELAVEVETEGLDVDKVGVSVQDVVGEIELTEEDMMVIDERLKELEMAIDEDSVDLKEMEELLLGLEAKTIDPEFETVEQDVATMEMEVETIEVDSPDLKVENVDTPELDTKAKKVEAPKPDVSAFDAKIEKLQKERLRLETPTAGDRIKAFFKHGFKGVKAEREQLETKIEATMAAKHMVLTGISTEVQRQKIEQLKESIEVTKHTLREHRGILAVEGLARGMNTSTGFTKEQLETAEIKGLEAEEKLNVLKAELKMEKKALSVREKLGMKDYHPGEGVKAPTHGHGV